MIQIPDGVQATYDAWLETEGVPGGERRFYRKWLRFYLDFCREYGHAVPRRRCNHRVKEQNDE